jgi:hypothetical protein
MRAHLHFVSPLLPAVTSLATAGFCSSLWWGQRGRVAAMAPKPGDVACRLELRLLRNFVKETRVLVRGCSNPSIEAFTMRVARSLRQQLSPAERTKLEVEWPIHLTPHQVDRLWDDPAALLEKVAAPLAPAAEAEPPVPKRVRDRAFDC